jgi:pimeloyl-ACP methyl ester carboxylesterase
MIETFEVALPHGIRLSCRASGPGDAPVLLFLHGFPEAAFVWDELLERFGERFRCIAPNLRGYERSSAPAEVEAYRARHLVADIVALIEHGEHGGGRVEALIAHDWGGAVAWNLAAARPDLLRRLVIVNSPHPTIFLRELQHNPRQQAASRYMNYLCRGDAEALLGENDFARLWTFFDGMGARDGKHAGGGWMTEAVRERYRVVWRAGLRGGCNYYRASPLRPPEGADSALMHLSLPPVIVNVPTRVIWGQGDRALLPTLLDGLDAYVPKLRLVRVPDATHWIVHERADLVAREIETALREG